MGQTMGQMFNPQVSGTGQSVRDLTKLGYSPDDIQTMGVDQSGGQKLAGGLLKGGLQGLGQGLQNYSQQRRPMPYGAPMGLNPSGVNNTNPFYGQ